MVTAWQTTFPPFRLRFVVTPGSNLELTGDERDDAFDPDRPLVFFGACHQVQAAAAAGHQVRAFVGAQDFQVIASRITEGVLILDMRRGVQTGL